jgi:hypothetical protein
MALVEPWFAGAGSCIRHSMHIYHPACPYRNTGMGHAVKAINTAVVKKNRSGKKTQWYTAGAIAAVSGQRSGVRGRTGSRRAPPEDPHVRHGARQPGGGAGAGREAAGLACPRSPNGYVPGGWGGPGGAGEGEGETGKGRRMPCRAVCGCGRGCGRGPVKLDSLFQYVAAMAG